MINLLKNEYIKVFKKKGIIILLIIMSAFALLTNFLIKSIDSMMSFADNDTYIEQDYKYAKEDYEKDKKNIEARDWYLSTKNRYDINVILKKYDKDSWQRAYLEDNSTLYSYVEKINNYEVKVTDNKAEYEMAKKSLDEFLKKIDSHDWKDIVKEEKENIILQIKSIDEAIDKKSSITDSNYSESRIDKYNGVESFDELESLSLKELKFNKKSLEITLKRLNRQLDEDISFADREKYNQLTSFELVQQQLLNYEDKNIDKLSNEEKSQYYELREEYFKLEYSLNSPSNANTVGLSDILETFYDNYLLMIVIFIFMIAGPIVSQEFNKGTIKLLLVKPYSRSKILLSKYIVALSSILMAIIFMLIIQLIIGGLFFGFSSLSDKIVVYSSITDSAQYINVLKYFVLISVAILPRLIILATLTFAASSIINNTAVSIITGFVGYMGTNILTLLLEQMSKKAWVKFFIGFNWDFKPYILKTKPLISGIDFKFSVMICIIYFLILIIPAFIVFKHKDIKNI